MPRRDDMDFGREERGLAGCGRAAGGAAAYGRPFPLTGDQPHYARDLVVDVRHIKLEIRIDPAARRIAGTATHTVRAINDGVRAIEFDAAEMTIEGVTVAGRPVKFDYADPVLRVDFGRALRTLRVACHGGQELLAVTEILRGPCQGETLTRSPRRLHAAPASSRSNGRRHRAPA